MKLDWKALTILSVAHLITDVNQGALPALLPYFKESLNLSYTVAGVILLFSNVTSSVIQPLFGYLSDKRPISWFLPIAPVIACLGMSLTGWVPNYSLLLLCVVMGGLGVASFHPEGFKTASFFTGEKKATGMSIFAVGGNFGIALGPVFALTLVTAFGIRGTLGLIVPGIVMGAILLFSLSWLTTPIHAAFTRTKKEVKSTLTRKEWIPLFLLIAIVMVRSWIQLGLVSYIPFYYITYLNGDPLYAGKLVSTFLMAGAFGTLLGSPLADRWGHRKFLSVSLVLMFPLLILFYNTEGFSLFIVLAISGMVLVSSFGITVVMGQAIIPQRLGMASGLMVGFAIGAGGVGVTLLGVIADHWGVPTALKTIVVLPLVGFVLSLLIQYPPTKTG
ncbi:MAG TPA: MFS transporter [Thermodesulfobacteriota bacterium]|nr:MFS transporter [Thermodesulfobacteriota bacterium]